VGSRPATDARHHARRAAVAAPYGPCVARRGVVAPTPEGSQTERAAPVGTPCGNVRVTDRSVSRRIGVWYGNSDIRQPPGVVATDKYTLVGWDDTRHGDETTQAQDIYAAMLQYERLGSSMSSSVQYVVAAAAGLGVLGLVLLVIVFAGAGPRDPGNERARQGRTTVHGHVRA